MGRRLMLLAEGSHVAAWVRASGNESAVRVRDLGGGKAWLEVELFPGGKQVLLLVEGLNSLLSFSPSTWSRYRAVKHVEGLGIMTSVEVILG